MYEMEGALLDLPIQAGRFAWQHRLRRADRRDQPPASGSVSRLLPRPRSFPWEVSVSDVEVFLLLKSRAAQASEGSN
jgi:hypothetical protein